MIEIRVVSDDDGGEDVTTGPFTAREFDDYMRACERAWHDITAPKHED